MLTEKLKEHMVVGKTVYTGSGTIIISKGTRLKERYIKKIKEFNIHSIYVEEDSVKVEEIKDIIIEETRVKGIALMKNIMDTSEFSSTIPVNEIKGMVNEIVGELIDNDEIMIHLADIRSVDDYTFGHSVNVCVLSVVTGLCMELSRNQLKDLGVGAILHDIGKTKIPDKILNKPGQLTEEEFEEIKKHTTYGYDLLKTNIGLSEISCRIALSHHERFDGKGYPKSRKGEDIDYFSRIVSIVDVYDALTTDRVYKRRVKIHEAVEYLISMGGHQFDYNIVRKFLENIAIFPLGSGVVLNTGEKGYVTKVIKEFPTRPVVKVTHNANGKKLKKQYHLDLVRNNSMVILDTTDDI